MVISHKYQYVFVQLEKTASSAIARELCEYYDGREILWKHARYEDFLAVATPEEKKYFAFAGVRNPLDIIVSRYHLRMLGRGNKIDKNNLTQHLFLKKHNNFGDFFLKFYARDIYDDWKTRYYKQLDYIYRYENLQADFNLILNQLKIIQIRPLPWFNETPNKLKFQDYYRSEKIQSKARVAFEKYCRKWGYDFPDHWSKLNGVDIFIWRPVLEIKYFFKKIVHTVIDSPILYRWRMRYRK